MAIKFKELNDKLLYEPLNDTEKTSIILVENYIDKIIIDVFNGEPIKIQLTIANFTISVDLKNRLCFAEARRKLMYDELLRRYNKAGWLTTEEITHFEESYNNHDYLILTGNNESK